MKIKKFAYFIGCYIVLHAVLLRVGNTSLSGTIPAPGGIKERVSQSTVLIGVSLTSEFSSEPRMN